MDFRLLLVPFLVSCVSIANAGQYTLTQQDVTCLKQSKVPLILYKSVVKSPDGSYKCIGDGVTYYLSKSTVMMKTSPGLQSLPIAGKTIYTNLTCNPGIRSSSTNQVTNANLNSLGLTTNQTPTPASKSMVTSTQPRPSTSCSAAFISKMSNP